MATTPIPAGTCNGSVNCPVPLWRDFCRLAAMRGMSAGEYARELFRAEVDAAKAKGIEIVREAAQQVMPWGLCLVIGLGFAATIVAAAIGQSELRRPANGRVVNSIAVVRRVGRREWEVA
jgi:glycerate-2-kinase